MSEKRARGFAAMDAEQQRRIASMGGRAAHERGTAHEWDSREAAEAGRKGGKAAHHRGTARVTNGTNGAAHNGHVNAQLEEADGSVRSRFQHASQLGMDSRQGSPGQGASVAGSAAVEVGSRREPQWSETEYENRGTPGAGIGVGVSGANNAAVR
jgi:general stress protein YciG